MEGNNQITIMTNNASVCGGVRDDDLSVLGSRRRREQLVSHHQPSVPLRSSQPQPRPALCSDCPLWPVNTLSDHELYRHLMCVVCYIIDF